MAPSSSQDQSRSLGVSKRKSASHDDQRIARRQRGVEMASRKKSSDFRDEAWLRKKMHIPTTTDYPDLPRNLFKEPKAYLGNAVQGLATLKSTFSALAEQSFRCMLRYESVVRAEAVEGDGRSKVGSLSLVLERLLNIRRNLPNKQRTCI